MHSQEFPHSLYLISFSYVSQFSLERKLPLDQVFLASVGVSGYKTGTEQLKVEAEDNTRDIISLISNIPMDFQTGYLHVGIPAGCP